eukprot:CAMPEP_0184295714 /NCGR_PEP_ID=MMETSP1049-20130417/6585_1 /TAXON_ID=77928 /ORGANISM="Proteomonas sulcata, Strain CCMP704" /LENGTH=165 /DNA_ID=CAMNT_0026604433 /DNA_START=80 /DNA_END=578 /DNA_ORIENTATION=-
MEDRPKLRNFESTEVDAKRLVNLWGGAPLFRPREEEDEDEETEALSSSAPYPLNRGLADSHPRYRRPYDLRGLNTLERLQAAPHIEAIYSSLYLDGVAMKAQNELALWQHSILHPKDAETLKPIRYQPPPKPKLAREIHAALRAPCDNQNLQSSGLRAQGSGLKA